MYRLNDVKNGKVRNMFSSKNEIKLNKKKISTTDLENIFKKVKEALEVS